MAAFLYRCPIVGMQVQAWTADDHSDDEAYATVTCLACQQVTLPVTGFTRCYWALTRTRNRPPQLVPEVVALVRELHGQRRQSLRQISKTLAAHGHLTGGGRPYTATAVQKMLRGG
jgi:hypothetical protein